MEEKVYVKPSKEEIKNKLSYMQYKVTQENLTEKPYINLYNNNFEEGIYVDIVSGEPLFSSKDKLNLECGWPTFSKVLIEDNVVENNNEENKVELRSKIADSHLGYKVLDESLEGNRFVYYINSEALKFIPKENLKKEGYKGFIEFFKE